MFATLFGPILILCVGFFGTLWVNERRKLAAMRAAKQQLHRDLTRMTNEAQFYKIACENANDGLVVQKMNGQIIWVNPAYCRIMGRPANQIIGRNPLSFAPPLADRPAANEIANFRFNYRDIASGGLDLARNVRADGTIFWNQISRSYHIAENHEEMVILVCRDVTEQILKDKKHQETSKKLAHLTAHDDLTGVANRETLIQFVNEALLRLKSGTKFLGMFRIDVDKFKDINDAYGQDAGDAVLLHLARKFQTILRQSDMIARINGDKFIVVCPCLRDQSEIQNIASVLTASVIEPVRFKDRIIDCTISVGATLSNPLTVDTHELLLQSDLALKDAKRRGTGKVLAYDDTLHKRYSRERRLAADLKHALHTQSLGFNFSPVIGLMNGAINGFATLVNWQHPTLGQLQLDDFIDVAKKIGGMADVDFAAMDAALALKTHLNETGYDDMQVGFDASSECLAHPQFLERLLARVGALNIAPATIAIQLHETAFHNIADDNAATKVIVQQLNDIGFHTTIGGFGIGQASLGLLAQLDVKAIKIDKSLTRDLAAKGAALQVLKSIIQLCQELNIHTTCTDVQSQNQYDVVRMLGGHSIQGKIAGPTLKNTEVVPFLQATAHDTTTGTPSAIAPAARASYLRANS